MKSWSIHESESQDSLSPTLSAIPSLVPCGVAEQAFLVVGNPQCPVEEGQYEVQREKVGSTCGPGSAVVGLAIRSRRCSTASILKRKGNFNHRQIDPVGNLVRLCEVSHLNSNLRSQSLLRAVRLL